MVKEKEKKEKKKEEKSFLQNLFNFVTKKSRKKEEGQSNET